MIFSGALRRGFSGNLGCWLRRHRTPTNPEAALSEFPAERIDTDAAARRCDQCEIEQVGRLVDHFLQEPCWGAILVRLVPGLDPVILLVTVIEGTVRVYSPTPKAA